MNYTRFIPVAVGALLALAPFASCSDNNDGPTPPPPTPPEPEVIGHSPLEPFVDFGKDVPYIRSMEKRELHRDTTKVLYGWQTIRTLIYRGGEEDIAFYYYYHFKQAELYSSEMLCPYNPETTAIIDSIFNAQYKYWRWSDVNTCDMYLTPDSMMSIRKEIWTDESIGMDLYRVVYEAISPEDVKKYYE